MKSALRHLAGAHGKLFVLDLTATDNVPHPHIVRRIKKGHGGFAPVHEAFQRGGVAGIPAEDAVGSELPKFFQFA